MGIEENRSIVRYFWEEVFNQGNLEMADQLFAPDHMVHISSLRTDEVGTEVMKSLVAIPRAVSPDILVFIEDEVAEEDKVVTSWTARGTLAYDTADEVTTSGINIYRVFEGRIRETWWHVDARANEPQGPPQYWVRERVRERLLEAGQPVSEEVMLGWCCSWFTACCF
jgi:predicted SnoaL-like aldol condensation-catalyzing enzyme